MDMLMKIMMGGWIPVEKRTQWVAFGGAITTILTAFFGMGAGDVGVQAFFQLLSEKWDVLLAFWGLYFFGEKVDNKAMAVKK